jgi:hypothetical protein
MFNSYLLFYNQGDHIKGAEKGECEGRIRD